MSSRLKNLYPTALITLVIVIAVSLLVTSESITRAVLETKQDQETLELLQQIFPEADFYAYDEDTQIYTLYDSIRKEIGYAFYGSSRGFLTDIFVLIGLEDTETIKGIIVTKQFETWSYWKLLVESNFFDQFIGLKIENCYLTKENKESGQVDAVTRATYSSRGVTNAVREAALEKIEYLD